MITSFFKSKSGSSTAPAAAELPAKKRKLAPSPQSSATASSNALHVVDVESVPELATAAAAAAAGSKVESLAAAPSAAKPSESAAAPLPLPAAPAPDASSFAHLEQLLPADWTEHVGQEFKRPYWSSLKTKLLEQERAKAKIFPPVPLIFNAFSLTRWDACRVVIIGQDPYHDSGQAHGLCFSVPRGVAVPSSLKNVYKELRNDIPGFAVPNHGYLESWAKQGVLLLNTSLTVRAHEANSHKDYGWQTFTDAVIKTINQQKSHVVFLLWGQGRMHRHVEASGAQVAASLWAECESGDGRVSARLFPKPALFTGERVSGREWLGRGQLALAAVSTWIMLLILASLIY
jgi:uracil-DNA glycosylase